MKVLCISVINVLLGQFVKDIYRFTKKQHMKV